MAIQVDNVRLPENIEAGASVGPMFQTSVVPLSNGREEVNQDWEEDLVVADISWGMMTDRNEQEVEESFKAINDFFMLRRGRARAFLFRNPLDFEASKEVLYRFPNDGTRLQLAKTVFDAVTSYKKRVTRPETQTIVLYVKINNTFQEVPPDGGNGVPGWTVEPLGVIKFATVIDDDADIYADFYYDIPMRFESDAIRVVLQHMKAGEIPEITIKQIRE